MITQLSSGTSLSQTLAQQGGQIFQLFQNRIGPAIKSALTNPAVLAGIASFAVLAFALKEAADQADRLRAFQGALATDSDGGLYDPAKLSASALALSKLGVASADATTAIKQFALAGVASDRLDEFGRTASYLAETLGIKVPDAAKKLTDAFTGGYTAIVHLDEETNFLTASQLKNIKALYEAGDAQAARTAAFKIFSDQQSAAADLERGPWSDAVRSFGGAWKDLLAALGNNGVIAGAIKGLGDIAEAASRGINLLTNRSKIAELNATIDALRKAREESRAAGTLTPSADDALGSIMAKDRAARDALINGTTPPASSSGDTQAANTQRTLKANDAVSTATEAILRTTRLITAEKRLQASIDTARAEAIVALSSDELKNADKATQKAYIAAAVEKARKDTQKQLDDEANQAAADRQRAITQFESQVIGAEGTGPNKAGSSASGVGQFMPKTYLQYFAKAYGDAGQSRDQILATRDNPGIAKGVLDAFTKANADLLDKFGQKITAGNLYVMHMLGAGDASKVFNANQNATVDNIGLSSQVLSQNHGYFYQGKTNAHPLTVGQFRTFLGNKVDDGGSAQSTGAVENAKLIQDGIDKQKEFNLAVEQQDTDRDQIISSLTAENGLRDAALTAAQRQAAIEKAIVALRQKAADSNKGLKSDDQRYVTLSDTQVANAANKAGGVFDAQHPAQGLIDQRAPLDRNVADLGAQRSAIQAQMQALQGQGEQGLSDQLKPQLADVTAQFQAALAASKAFYDSLSGASDADLEALHLTRDQVENIKLGLDTAKVSAVDLGSFLGIQFTDIIQKFASGAANAFESFAKAVGSGRNVFHSLRDAFLQFASSFLQQIAQMIIQQLVFNAISAFAKVLGLGSAGVGAAGSSASGIGAIGGVQAHSGGIIGGEGPTSRAVNPAWFANAARYHTGGIAGLQPNEVAAVLQRNEEVLTTADPRH